MSTKVMKMVDDIDDIILNEYAVTCCLMNVS